MPTIYSISLSLLANSKNCHTSNYAPPNTFFVALCAKKGTLAFNNFNELFMYWLEHWASMYTICFFAEYIPQWYAWLSAWVKHQILLCKICISECTRTHSLCINAKDLYHIYQTKYIIQTRPENFWKNWSLWSKIFASVLSSN